MFARVSSPHTINAAAEGPPAAALELSEGGCVASAPLPAGADAASEAAGPAGALAEGGITPAPGAAAHPDRTSIENTARAGTLIRDRSALHGLLLGPIDTPSKNFLH